MNQPRVVRAVVAALAGFALALSGCASISNVQTADTLGKGNIQAGIEPGIWGVVSGGGPVILPHVDAAVRYGVSDSVDVGVRAGSSFLELQGKFLFTRAGDPNLAVSLGPTLGGIFVGGGGASAGLLNIGIPVLIGIKTSGGSEFVIGPRVQNFLIFGGASTSSGGGSALAVLVGVGGSLGFAWRITDNFGLMPEFSAVYPVVGGAAASGLGSNFAGLNAGGAFIQFKLGILIGRFRKLQQNEDIQQGAPPPPPPPPPGYQSPPPPPPPPPAPM